MSPVPLAPSPMVGAVLEAPPPPSEGPKAEFACLVCRSRKVRCDRTLPSCRNCVRLGVPCPGYDRNSESISRKQVLKSAEDIFRAAGVEKRRVGSCEECRASKHRCTRTRPSCRRCLVRKLPCVYPSKPDREDRPEDDGPRNGSPLEVGPEVSADFGIESERLYSDTLPDDPALRLRLVESFFQRSHHLRCLSFLHKPSFMQSLDRESVVQDYGEPLLYAVCALGARHIYFDAAAASPASKPSDTNLIPGHAWAEKARKEVLCEVHAPTLQHLMTMLLLCDYGLRADQNAMVFVLISFLYRTIRLLSLDSPEPLESPASPDEILQREMENRVVWSCYFIDVFVASGVEKNSCWKDYIPDIPLPCPEQNFLSCTLSAPQYLQRVEEVGIVPAMPDLDLFSLTIVVSRLRWDLLRLIRVPDGPGDIWDPSSKFLDIIHRLEGIYRNLPERFALNDLNFYTLKEANLLGGVFFFHLILHAVIFDLTRISLAGFNFPLAAAFHRAPPEFRLHCQDMCRYHACKVSDMIRWGLQHGRMTFDDIYCGDAVLESSKIQIIYASTVNRSPQVVQATRENLRTHLQFLEMFNHGKNRPSQFIRTLLPMCMLFGFRDIAQEYAAPFSANDDQVEVSGSADIDHLSQLAPFRRARIELKKAKSNESPMTLSSGHTQTSPLAQISRQPTSTMETSPMSNDYVLPPLQASYPPEPQAQPQPQRQPPAPLMPELPPPMMNQMLPPNGAMLQNDAMIQAQIQAQVDEYLKAADEMSNYMTWDMTQLPSWTDFGDMLPPA